MFGKRYNFRTTMLKQSNPPQNMLTNILAAKPFLMAILSAVIAFMLYLLTLVPEVGWGDSAELSLVAYQLGLTHPPGYPLHSILGKLVSVFFSDPAIGTNLLSAVCASVAAGVMSLILYDFKITPWVTILIPVFFSVLPNIWEMAVVTEVYDVNILFLGCSIYLFLRAQQTQFNKFFLSSAILFGLSLGTYQANLILLPVFLFVLWIEAPRGKALNRLLMFSAIVGLFWLAFLGYSVIRSQAALAINYQLTSFLEIATYATGANLRPSFPKDFAFYIGRTIQHTSLFSKNFLYFPIPIGLMGAFALFKQRRAAGLFLGGMFAVNYLFFSYYAVSDFATMPTLSYFIFSIFIGYGFAFLSQKQPVKNEMLEFGIIALCVCLVGAQLFNQLPARLDRSNTRPVTEFIIPALEAFPKDAIVISQWERYGPLLYFQQVHHIREDITLVISDNYLDQIGIYYAQMPGRPILIDNHSDMLSENYRIKRYHRRWFLIVVPLGNDISLPDPSP